ncbi:hypothetical protein ABZ894_07735 [Nocardia beijingensis]|uniref:hypothetical protein n=1 Tax=Nocardia beijingensis TaxID=95162 RepID=UPI0033DD0ABF
MFDPAQPVGVRNMPPWDQLELIHLSGGVGHNFLVMHEGVPIGAYKPRDNSNTIRDEVSAWEADNQMLGLGLVPYTREWVGPRGRGTLQEFVPNNGPCFDYRNPQGQALAVFDYIMSHGDRHYLNALNRADVPGGIAAIDNEGILHTPNPEQGNAMRSNAIAQNFDQPLDPLLIEHLRTVDPERFSEFLQSLDYPASAADWAALRLAEIQEHGKITGEAWGAAIVNEQFKMVYPPGYAHLYDYIQDLPRTE